MHQRSVTLLLITKSTLIPVKPSAHLKILPMLKDPQLTQWGNAQGWLLPQRGLHQLLARVLALGNGDVASHLA